ncbi:verrucotoxin subunit beta-like [Pimephales promelas]|uniref:verrucotoxin subunit beta-like n=1 Tax=Pimephales promelas TaxID=90988 RepID=UPI0019556B09|nr:verrucotoxin subunit beta-like [Pimephales promelas]
MDPTSLSVRYQLLLEELASSVQSWSPQSPSTAANQAQTPAAPVPLQFSVSTSASYTSTPLPEKFNGSPVACEGFLQQCSLYTNHQPQFYTSDYDRVSFICSLLTGKAQEWTGTFWEPGRMSFPSYDVFTALFRKAFELSAEKEDPEELLLSLRRGVTVEISPVEPEFERVPADSKESSAELSESTLASQPIEVAALGRPLFPGMLYDCRKDTFIPAVTLWDKKSLTEDLDTRPQPRTNVKFSSSDSLSSKSSLLDVSASLKASFLGGLVEVGGSAKFLRDSKSSNQQSRVTMYYSETSRFEQLTMTHLGKITYPQVFDQKTATHVVTAVLYGAQAVMVFDRTFSEEEDKQEIEGELDVMVKKIPKFSIEGQGAVNMTDAQMKVAEGTACTFYGDVHLEQNPTTYTEALEVYKKLPTILKENPLNAVPIKVWLHPLSLLDTKAARLEREITTHLVSKTEDIIEGLGEVQRTCNGLSKKPMENVFNDIKERLSLFQGCLNIYQTVLLKAVAKVLPAIRGGEMEQKSLEDILKIHYSSPFNADMLNQWLDHATAELNLLSSHTETLKGIKTVDSNCLKTILFNPNIDVVVGLTLTSLKYEDPDLSNLKKFLESDEFKELDVVKLQSSTVASVRKWFNDPNITSKMRENLSLFRSFSEANKDEKRYRFIISAISDPSSPGSSIYLYEKGKLTDTQFQPVSKPPPPEVKEILEDSVSLKLQKSPTGETVQFRVEYQQVKADSDAEEQWMIINTADEDFTLTGLKSGKQYLIRYRIVGKVGVSEASGTIGPIQSSGKCHKPFFRKYYTCHSR